MNAMREHLGLAPIDPNLIYSFVGNGVRVLVERALGPDAQPERIDQGYRFFLAHYRDHALDNTKLYDGIRELLAALKQHRLAILTNKPTAIALEIVGSLQIADYFVKIYGGDSLPDKKPSPVGLLALMEEFKASPEQTLMVGDSSVDVQTARNASVKSCGVKWGFQPELLLASHPDVLVDTPNQIIECLY